MIFLHMLGLILILVDFALYLITLGPLYTIYKLASARRVFAREIHVEFINGQDKPPSKVWRSVEAVAAGHLVDGADDGATAYEALTKVYKEHASLRAQGSRTFIGWRTDEGHKFPAKVFGETTWRTFGELGERAHAFGAGLRFLGLSPQAADAKRSDHRGVLIYEETCADWMLCAQGCTRTEPRSEPF
mmetsp:Transcript_12369/g.24834  ORF Transcript_12369/g.24834 Transcript_12369/m.24834 type:complete len:188 (+) Transcript_12369:243-806(+)